MSAAAERTRVVDQPIGAEPEACGICSKQRVAIDGQGAVDDGQIVGRPPDDVGRTKLIGQERPGVERQRSDGNRARRPIAGHQHAPACDRHRACNRSGTRQRREVPDCHSRVTQRASHVEDTGRHGRCTGVAIGACEYCGAREHINSTVAADRGRKHVVGGRVIEVERTDASAKCEARRRERPGRSRPGLPAAAPILTVPIAPVFAAITIGAVTMPPSAIVSVPVPELPILTPAMSLQREPAPVTVTVPCEPAPLPMLVTKGVISITLPPLRS